MNIIGKLKAPGDVPTPPAGYATFFVNTTGNVPNIKLPDGSILTLQGVQGVKGDTGEITSVSIEMLPPDGTASVTNTGTSTAAALLFKLPQSSVLRKTSAVQFTDGDTVQRITITDATVSPSTPPSGFSISHIVTDEADETGYAYSVTLVQVGTGSFTVLVSAQDPDGDGLIGLPLPTVTLNYFTGA